MTVLRLLRPRYVTPRNGPFLRALTRTRVVIFPVITNLSVGVTDPLKGFRNTASTAMRRQLHIDPIKVLAFGFCATFWLSRGGLLVRLAVSDWQPIETAPRDGTRIIAARLGASRSEAVCWSRVGEWVSGGLGYPSNWFTHWMPLPPPPQTPGEQS